MSKCRVLQRNSHQLAGNGACSTGASYWRRWSEWFCLERATGSPALEYRETWKKRVHERTFGRGNSRPLQAQRVFEIDDLRESENLVAIAALNWALCDILCGCPRAARLRGLCNVLVHRYRGLTRRWESDADAMRAALPAHDDTCCARRSRRTTASCSAIPATVSSRVRIAEVCHRGRRSPRSRRWSYRYAWGLRPVEPASRATGDYFGTALNRTARVMSAGHGGQVLVAGTRQRPPNGSRSGRLGSATVARPPELRSRCFN